MYTFISSCVSFLDYRDQDPEHRLDSANPQGLTVRTLILCSAAHLFRSLNDGSWRQTARTPSTRESLLRANMWCDRWRDPGASYFSPVHRSRSQADRIRPLPWGLLWSLSGSYVRSVFADKGLVARLWRNSTWNAQMTQVIGWEFKTS